MAESKNEAISLGTPSIDRHSPRLLPTPLLPSAHRASPVSTFGDDSTQDADPNAFAYHSDNDDDLAIIGCELKSQSVGATSMRLHDEPNARTIQSPMSDLAMHISKAILSDGIVKRTASK